jgi:hypothetical protein
MIGVDDCGAISGMRIGRGNQSTQRIPEQHNNLEECISSILRVEE